MRPKYYACLYLSGQDRGDSATLFAQIAPTEKLAFTSHREHPHWLILVKASGRTVKETLSTLVKNFLSQTETEEIKGRVLVTINAFFRRTDLPTNEREKVPSTFCACHHDGPEAFYQEWTNRKGCLTHICFQVGRGEIAFFLE